MHVLIGPAHQHVSTKSRPINPLCLAHQLPPINSGSNSGSSQPQWRAKRSHDEFVEPGTAIVVGEMIYFKIDAMYLVSNFHNDVPPDCIIPFNLEKEEWGGILPGPLRDIFCTEYDGYLVESRRLWIQTTLADLKGSLALVHHHGSLASEERVYHSDSTDCANYRSVCKFIVYAR